MKRLIVAAIVIGLFAGCQIPTVGEAKVEAQERWQRVLARARCQIGVEHLKVGQLEPARRRALEALALDEDYVDARVLLGKVCIEQGHYRAAINEFEKVLTQNPNCEEWVYLLGVAQEKDGRLQDALSSYRRAHKLNNSSLAAVKAAAEVLVAMGRTREAQLHLQSYIHLAQDDPGAFELGGRLAMMQKEYSEAAHYYEQACDLDFENVRYREALAHAQFFAGQYAEARDTLKDLTESKDYAAAVWVHTMLGDCHMATDRPFSARDEYQLASRLKPKSAGIWASLGKAALALNDVPRAILSADRALSLEKGCLDATLLLGYALLRDGQGRRALGVLTEAATRHPESGTLRCLLGRAHAASGDNAQAARCYVAALKLEPDNQLARELLRGCGAAQGASLID